MDANQTVSGTKKDFSYKFTAGVHLAEKDTNIFLIRDNPLSTIDLDRAWQPAFNRLKEGDFIPFEELCSLVDAASDKIEIYLNSLVRKGYLDSTGYRELDNYPSITIIIPVRNRPDEIFDCLTSLEKLDYPSEKLEIIVIDDASRDNTPEVVSGFPVRLIKNTERMQASYCRNLGAKEAKGEILAFLDSDCMVHPLWIKELVPAFIDKANGAAGGKVDSWFDKKALDRYEKVSSSLNMGDRSKSSKEEGDFFYLPACNFMVKKEIFINSGGFDIELSVGEDVDFCWRLKDRGFEIEYRPGGIVFHRHRNKTGAFFIRRLQYGISEPFLQKKHPDRVKNLFYPPLTVLLWLLLCMSLLTGNYLLLIMCCIIPLVDTTDKWFKVKKKDLPIKYIQILPAVSRGYFVSLYYWGAFFSRYYLIIAFLLLPVYLIIAFLLLPVLDTVCLVLFINHLIISFCEYYIKKPFMGVIGFVYFFTIDQLAYQIGVWYGCFKYLAFNPVNPKMSRWTT